MIARLLRANQGASRLTSRWCATYSGLEQGPRSFPWRNAPQREAKPVWQELLKAVAYKFLYTRTFVTDYDAQDFWDKFMEEGANTAFRTVTDAIFKHRLLQRSEEGSADAVDAPDLNRVVEAKLARFYEQALQDVNSNGQHIVYELLELGRPTIPTMELLVGLHRDDPAARRKACKRTRGLLNLDLFGTLIPRDDLSDTDLEEAWDAIRGSDKVVLRVWVDIKAMEKFYIVDDVTGETVQGTDVPEVNVHRLLFETSFYTTEMRNMTEADHAWEVVDIDNWLGGNPFYVIEDDKPQQNKNSEADDEARS